MLSLIAAVAENNCIGLNGKMPWHISADLKYFKEKTKGKTLIMGANTYYSLGSPLKGREHIVLTREPAKHQERDNVAFTSETDEIFAKYQAEPQEVFVIGGGEIYIKALPYCAKLYITEIYESFPGDTFFPKIDANIFKKTDESEKYTDENTGVSYRFTLYSRKNADN
ncbi:MAG: dihydrofolate reductase [Clostridiales bacterium]|jgi:dihydrofolate reductase|nr:dihydrofolate reductase [Clostridiales bacterium]